MVFLPLYWTIYLDRSAFSICKLWLIFCMIEISIGKTRSYQILCPLHILVASSQAVDYAVHKLWEKNNIGVSFPEIHNVSVWFSPLNPGLHVYLQLWELESLWITQIIHENSSKHKIKNSLKTDFYRRRLCFAWNKLFNKEIISSIIFSGWT